MSLFLDLRSKASGGSLQEQQPKPFRFHAIRNSYPHSVLCFAESLLDTKSFTRCLKRRRLIRPHISLGFP